MDREPTSEPEAWRLAADLTEPDELVLLPRRGLLELLGRHALPPWRTDDDRLLGVSVDAAPIAALLLEELEHLELEADRCRAREEVRAAERGDGDGWTRELHVNVNLEMMNGTEAAKLLEGLELVRRGEDV